MLKLINCRTAARNLAFTLAEVLITLGIIGIVSALVIPGMIAKYTERQTVIRLKHTYSLLSQAITNMIAEHGNLNYWSDDSLTFFTAELNKQLQSPSILKKPGYSDIANQMNSKYPVYILNNGVAYQVFNRIKNDPSGSLHTCKVSVSEAISGKGEIHYGSCAYIYVDINGNKIPNTFGKDRFEFRVYTDGVLPKGIKSTLVSWNDDFERSCFISMQVNTTCTAWVIYNENMDYLHCRDKLSWNGARSCKQAANI